MNSRRFSLKPFPGLSFPAGIELSVVFSRNPSRFQVAFELAGNRSELEIPPFSRHPERRNELWQATCFEWFLGHRGDPGYWEFNLSPAGHWNVYRFEGYRQGMKEETLINRLSGYVVSDPERLEVGFTLAVGKFPGFPEKPEGTFTAVIRTASGEVSFWALTHLGKEPDFHRREAFVDLSDTV